MPNAAQTIPAVYAYSGLDGIDYTPVGAVTAGTVINVGTGGVVMYGIARQYIPAGVAGNLAIVGCFDLLLDGSSQFNVGDVVYWNANTNKATSSGSYSSDIIGLAVVAAATTDVSVRVWLTSAYLR